ncbi:MAG: hypothetical protein FJ267_17640 [Planctomycetes bacterium]|nr:hypothetical protein [Planctomycetota bacterium]
MSISPEQGTVIETEGSGFSEVEEMEPDDSNELGTESEVNDQLAMIDRTEDDLESDVAMDEARSLRDENADSMISSLEDSPPIGPFKNLAGKGKSTSGKKKSPLVERHPWLDWGIASAVMLMCSVLAWQCYRRGTT